MAEKLKDGLHRCPHCGSSDVALDAKEGKLKCAYCKTLFEAKSANEYGGVEGMKGETRGAGAEDIIPGDDIVKTFKCPSCGAEVVINTDESTDASCHWCRHIFTVNEAVSNGAVPDLVLPFKITKEEAIEKVRKCISGRSENIAPGFIDELDKRGVDGVYFPFMIVDVNARMEMRGQAEINLDKNKVTPPWRIETYEIERNFTLLVDDLTVESSAARLNQDTYINSNNIINAILPFDTENAAAWDANYLRGFSSEKRNVSVNSLKEVVALQSGDIGRRKAKETTVQYDRGVRWEKEHLGIKGTKWKSAYLPVWLYSYHTKFAGDPRIYYVAVNARTGETVGCLPLATGNGHYVETENISRHRHEIETNAKIEELTQKDDLTSSSGTSYSKEVYKRNDNRVIGALSTGRNEMLAVEKNRFQTGSNYTQAKRNSSSGSGGNLAGIIIFIVILLLILLFAGGGSGGGGGSSSYDSGWDYDYGSSYDYDYDWGGSDYDFDYDSGGFDYSYDY